MHWRKAGGCVTSGAGLVVPLITSANNGADPIPVASGADQLKINPVARFRTRVSPELWFIAEHSHHHVELSVAVKVRNRRSPMSARRGEGEARSRRAVRKRAVALIDE